MSKEFELEMFVHTSLEESTLDMHLEELIQFAMFEVKEIVHLLAKCEKTEFYGGHHYSWTQRESSSLRHRSALQR